MRRIKLFNKSSADNELPGGGTLSRRLIVPTVLMILLIALPGYFAFNAYFYHSIEKKALPIVLGHLRNHTENIVYETFSKAFAVGRYFTVSPSVVNFLRDEHLHPGTMDAELKQFMNFLKTDYNLSTIYLAALKSHGYYTEKGYLKQVDTMLEENRWFNDTLASPGGFMLNIDSAMADDINLWLDIKVVDKEAPHKVHGLGGIAIALPVIREMLREVNAGEDTHTVLIDKKMQLRLTGESEALLNTPLEGLPRYGGSYLEQIRPLIEQSRFGHGAFMAAGEKGEGLRHFALFPVEGSGFCILVDFPERNLFSQYDAVSETFWYFILVLMGVSFVMYYWLLRLQVLVPMRAIIRQLHNVYDEKSFDAELLVPYAREFNDIGHALEQASLKLIQKNRMLQHWNESLAAEVEERTDKLSQALHELTVINDECRDAKEKALEMAKAKSDFISSVSHELRTPLNAIINFTDMVLEDFDETAHNEVLHVQNREYLNRVLKNSQILLSLINDILDFSKIEAGKMQYRMQWIDLNAAVRTIFESTHSLALNSLIDYRLELGSDTIEFYVDRKRFSQIMYNFISNAFKFTEHGHILLRTEAVSTGFRVCVSDTGRGMGSVALEQIFIPFAQADSFDKGTGLGLSVSKKFADEMGLSISVRSQEGVGSHFCLEIPAGAFRIKPVAEYQHAKEQKIEND